jgi:hypothetical protein
VVEAGRLTKFEIEHASYPIASLPTWRVPNEGGGGIPELVIPPDPVWAEIERELLVCEGVMAMYGMRRIHIDDVTTEWIAESEEERGLISVSSFNAGFASRESKLPVFFDLIARSIAAVKGIEPIEVALNFNRRGRHDMDERLYIDAFHDFYFALETLFAGGQFQTRKVVATMQASAQLIAAIQGVQRDLASSPQFLAIQPKPGFAYLTASPSAVIKRVVELRGFLHHHASSNKNAWHPGRQARYMGDAVFLSSLTHAVLSAAAISEMFGPDATALFVASNIRTPDGEPVRFKSFEME